jgi:hypothetical protein
MATKTAETVNVDCDLLVCGALLPPQAHPMSAPEQTPRSRPLRGRAAMIAKLRSRPPEAVIGARRIPWATT